ncbi:endolytic transglycosylase MltG [Schnuerera sp. xch1]|uniref:endolytic transglycosylase MltG n=1 Tax=Schnuerera sp. xch1 TaxID=2874283 RepID=UPI001CBD615D|nr:endolytic transglycosylase MltG [Schnuerera sp. xch1]MBZ2173982.1 endolytic transglycosylase MltG [Schnuerera sp. xch1]
MFNKHRFPFILLGVGIGIVLTNIIYALHPNVKHIEYTEEEIIAEATNLGMVFVKDVIDIDKEKEVEEVEGPIIDEVKEIEFTVENGDSLYNISKRLYEFGIIEDPEEFQNYGWKKGVDKRIRVGTYTLSTDLDYDAIIDILTKKQQ